MATGGLLLSLSVWVTWLARVNQEVPQPYLDEVFHVPQAQEYCAGRWTSWDPKITTPPGLYLIAALLRPVFGCSTVALRLENAGCLVATAAVIWLILSNTRTLDNRQKIRLPAGLLQHSFNIANFPILFFFSALYYTDVASTLSTLAFHYIRVAYHPQSIWLKGIVLTSLGLLSLLFRQTNIFWIAVYPAAMTFIAELDQGHDLVRSSLLQRSAGFGDTHSNILYTSWKMGVIFDPAVAHASFSDYCMCIASTLICFAAALTSFAKSVRILQALVPYLLLITAFAGFIVWNGSVVLGDKSNHVATLHLPQMLYIWPYFTFFSWPFLYEYFFSFALEVLPRPMHNFVPQTLMPKTPSQRPSIAYLITFVFIGGAIVKSNTIVHPFTLADNRHYTFYVFRLLMRPWWMRYAVLPVYAVCAWICVQALGYHQHVAGTISHSRRSPKKALDYGQHAAGTKVSFVLVWLATTALQLITAPLVEPRYLILPWIFWRMALAMDSPDLAETNAAASQNVVVTRSPKSISPSSHTSKSRNLWCETIWFLVVNAATGYIFLHWKFIWLSEPDNWQRFMW